MTPAGLLNSSQNYSQCCSIFNKPNQKSNHYDCIKIIHCNKYRQLHYYGKSTPLGYSSHPVDWILETLGT